MYSKGEKRITYSSTNIHAIICVLKKNPSSKSVKQKLYLMMWIAIWLCDFKISEIFLCLDLISMICKWEKFAYLLFSLFLQNYF